MTLTEAIEHWLADAERMHGGDAYGVVVTEELLAGLAHEQGCERPLVAGRATFAMATSVPAGSGLPTLDEMVEVAGSDRVSIYVGVEPEASTFPLGLDPAMPVVFVPIPPTSLDNQTGLEMYNRLRWYGLSPEEALAGSRQ